MTIHKWINATVFTASVLTASLCAATASGSILFTEDFESPDVAANAGDGYTTGATPSSWVRASQGFGSTRHGITDKAGGDFSAPAGNDQAYAFRYTNSGITTGVGVIGDLSLVSAYVVSFDVVLDGGGTGATNTPYTAELVAFSPGDNRTEHRGGRPGSILASASGNAPGDGSFATISFSFAPDAFADAADLGKDLGLRFLGATNSAIIDNVTVAAVPESSTFALVGLAGLMLAGFAIRRARRK